MNGSERVIRVLGGCESWVLSGHYQLRQYLHYNAVPVSFPFLSFSVFRGITTPTRARYKIYRSQPWHEDHEMARDPGRCANKYRDHVYKEKLLGLWIPSWPLARMHAPCHHRVIACEWFCGRRKRADILAPPSRISSAIVPALWRQVTWVYLENKRG